MVYSQETPVDACPLSGRAVHHAARARRQAGLDPQTAQGGEVAQPGLAFHFASGMNLNNC